MDEKTTSTNAGIGDEGYKGSDLSEIEKIDRRETSVKGAENLINQDLAVIIYMNTFDGNLIHIFCVSFEQLMGIEGIGFGEAYQIKATFELMGIEVLDHIIIGIRDQVRFKESGLMKYSREMDVIS